MATEELVDRRTKPHEAPPRAERFDGEGQNNIVDHAGGRCALGDGHGRTPNTQASTPF